MAGHRAAILFNLNLLLLCTIFLTLTLRQVINWYSEVLLRMEIADTFDITTVCNDLGISSRTLRYYEEIGLIESTKSNCSKRRRYTKEQL